MLKNKSEFSLFPKKIFRLSKKIESSNSKNTWLNEKDSDCRWKE